MTKAVFGQFTAIHDANTRTHKIMPLPTVVVQAPKDATYNILLGVDFLKRFNEYYSNHQRLTFCTPCGHRITSLTLTQPTMRTHISFTPRGQHGEYLSKNRKKLGQKESTSLLNALHTTQKALEFCLEKDVKALLQANFDENPLKYWDKDKSFANIQLKEAHSINRVKPMRYNQADEKEFRLQLQELEERQLAYKSTEENKSPHSSPALGGYLFSDTLGSFSKVL